MEPGFEERYHSLEEGHWWFRARRECVLFLMGQVPRRSRVLAAFVPAFGFLWSGHDEANRHFRRYSKSGLLSALSQAGFSTARCSYWNFLLFFPAAFYRLTVARLIKNKDDLSLPPGPIDTLLSWLLSAENALLRSIDFPVGVSLFAIAKK